MEIGGVGVNWLDVNIVPSFGSGSWSVVSGSATINSNSIVMQPGSVVTVAINNTIALSPSSYMKFITNFYSSFSDDAEYNPKAYISVKLSFDETCQNSVLIFNRYSYSVDHYVDTTELDVEQKTITGFVIKIENLLTASSELVINSIEAYKSSDINVTQVADQTQSQIDTTLSGIIDYTLLKSINFSSTGFTATYDNKVMSFTYVYTSGTLTGLQSSGGRLINITYS